MVPKSARAQNSPFKKGGHKKMHSTSTFFEAGVTLLCAAVIFIIAYIIFFRAIHPEFSPFIKTGVPRIEIPGKDFYPLSGLKVKASGSALAIEEFKNGEAILVLPRAFRADDYPFIKLNLEPPSRTITVKIVWQQAKKLGESHAIEVDLFDNNAKQVAMVYGGLGYRGEIDNIALLFYEGPEIGATKDRHTDVITLHSVELLPFTPLRVAQQIYEDWTSPPLWGGASNNFILGAHSASRFFPNLAAHLIITLSIILIALRHAIATRSPNTRHSGRLIRLTLCICLYAWALNEVFRWNWRLDQLEDTYARYHGLTLDERIKVNKIRCARFPVDCGSHLLPYF